MFSYSQCFHLWDLDARGFHKVSLVSEHAEGVLTSCPPQGLWRFWLKGNHILVVGHPYSPYAE